MAVRYLFSASTRPRNPADFTGAASGGTITGASGTVELVFDDAIFGSTTEGKQRLISAIEALSDRLKSAKAWPITTSS
jgi:hypothetical protein